MPLGEIVEIVGGGTPSKRNPRFYGGSIPWATVRDMNVDELVKTEHSITEAGLAASSAKVIPAGEVVIATRVGLGKVCRLKRDTAINQDLRGLLPKGDCPLDRKYLFYWYKSISEKVVAAGTGATVQGVKLPFLKSLPIPLLPLEDQRRIVAILDEAFEGLDRARAHTEANLQNGWDLFVNWCASTFESVSNLNSIQTISVKDLALPEKGSIRTGPFGSQLLHSEFVEEGIVVLGIDNAVSNEFRWGKRRFITPEKYDQLRRFTVHPGDVVITIMGTCGRCSIIPGDMPTAINTKHLCCISLDHKKCLPEYLHRYFLLSPVARSYLSAEASGTVMDGLNMGIIKKMPVVLPSVDKQRELIASFAEVEARTKEVLASYEAQGNDLDELRQSLLQPRLRRRTDVS